MFCLHLFTAFRTTHYITVDKFFTIIQNISEKYNYQLKNVEINSLQRINKFEVNNIINQYYSQSIFLLPLEEISNSINQLSWTKDVNLSTNFIDKLENKYETKIGENGIRLSGGEKQRLSIARAILKKSKIILLDEATSSLDAETEDKIQKAISFLTKDRTTIVIAHRLSTILNSYKIYVIDSGNVVAEGNHQKLIDTSPIYKNFYNKQIKV